MILDLQNLISDSQTLAVAAGTVIATNKIDLGAAGTIPPGFQARGSAPHDLQGGTDMELLCQIDQTVTSGGALTLQVQIIVDDDPAMGSPVVLSSSAVIALATLVAGYNFKLKVPNYNNTTTDYRYLSAQYVIGTAAGTAGTITTALLMDKQTGIGVS